MLNIDKNAEIFLEQQKIIGYNSEIEPKKITQEQIRILKELSDLPENRYVNLPKISNLTLMDAAKKFYNENFDIHNVKRLTGDISKFYVNKDEASCVVQRRWDDLLSSISPFDIPLELTEGNSMVGNIEKITPIILGYDMSIIEDIPFVKIQLGNNLTTLSVPTYLHEIVHSQTEGKKGYTNNYNNKEVLSIFMEKLAASKIDQTGELLRVSEKMRFRHLAECLMKIYNYSKQDNSFNMSYKDVVESSMYIESTLKATKLYDIYETEQKEKSRRKIIYRIQDIFDGKMQVEELLLKTGVNQGTSQNLTFVKKRKSKI